MIWFFERDTETATCEVSRRSTHFEIAVRRDDGTESIDIAHDPRDLLMRIEDLPEQLAREGWRPKLRDVLGGTFSTGNIPR